MAFGDYDAHESRISLQRYFRLRWLCSGEMAMVEIALPKTRLDRPCLPLTVVYEYDSLYYFVYGHSSIGTVQKTALPFV